MMQDTKARLTASTIARDSYGRLLAILSSRTGDIAQAEDALADAFAKALDRWPTEGIPDNPEAWLVTVAKNRQNDIAKSAAVRLHDHSLDEEGGTMRETTAIFDTLNPDAIPDERLKLLFACAHPALDKNIHTPLMMQTVLGFEASEVASAYLMPASTLAQRLVRAKRKIKEAKIPFSIPDRQDMPGRLASVLEAIYGAYALGWDQYDLDATKDLASEALYLSSILIDLLPHEPEALGLSAFISFSFARRKARTEEEGRLIPLDKQDCRLWDRMLIRRGNTLLERASKMKAPGRFQIEAAIQSVHIDRMETGQTNWQAIAQLYNGLMALSPTSGSAVALASAVTHAYGPAAGLNALDHAKDIIGEKNLPSFQAYWATKAYIEREFGDYQTADQSYAKAISLTTDKATRLWLAKEQKQIRS